MKGKKLMGVVGKRIVAVEQDVDPTGVMVKGVSLEHWNVRCFVLEDGTRMWPMTIETETGEYFHYFGTTKPAKKRKP